MTKKTALARREALLALAAVLASGCATSAPSPTPAPPSGTVRLTLLHLADVYQVQAVEEGRGGMARAATLRKQVLRESPHVLTLMGGDTLSPSVESLVEVDGKALKGRHMVDAWNAFGLDYAVLGNHEFDFGDEVLRERIRESRFTWLGANVQDAKSGGLFAGVQASAIRELGGIKLGLFGVVLQETKATTKAGKDTHFGDVCEAARGAVAKLRESGAQVVVALTHLTADQDRALTRCVKVDAVLGGHDHEALEDRSTGTPIFKVAADAVDLGRLTLDVDAATATVRQVTWQTMPVTRQVPEDVAFNAAMQPYAALFNQLSEHVGRSPVPLEARAALVRTQETNLGSFVADAFRAAARADVALVNAGALRADAVLPAGGVTRRDLHAILPYADELVVLEVKGDTLRAALENGVSLSREDSRPGRFPQVSGLEFTFDSDRPAGQRVLGVTVGGRPLDKAATYRLATLSFLASGKDGYDMLRNQPSTPARVTGNSPLDVLAEAFRTGRPSPHAQADGRISRLGTGALAPDARQPPAPLK